MTSTYDGVGSGGWELQRPRSARGSINVGRTERWLSGVAGLVLAGLGLRRARLRSVLLPLGGSLLARGVTGRCPVNRALGRNSALGEARTSPVASLGAGEGIRVEQSVTINRQRQDLFRFWRNSENLPRFMDNLESVRVLDARLSHWVAKGPAGTRVEWDAEIHNEIENELIAWRSLPGSEVDHAGSVHFTPTVSGTLVRVILRYSPPAGKLGSAVAKLSGEDPERQVADDLRRLKQVMEAGEFTPV
ncbi:MAG: SRPBCC family protein [Gemmatimonadales bacterium]